MYVKLLIRVKVIECSHQSLLIKNYVNLSKCCRDIINLIKKLPYRISSIKPK